MPSSGPIARLQQLASALTSPGSLLGRGEASHTTFVNEHRNKFEPGLPAGLPVNHTPLNPVSFLLRSATIRPNRVALQHHDLGVQWTYAEWAMRICALAYGLKRRGVKAGDKVCIICPNVPMILDCIQALPAIHAIMVPMNIRLTKPEVDYILEHSGSSAIIVDRDFVHLTKGFKGLVIVSNDTGGKDREDPYEQVIAEGQQDADTKGWQGLPLIADEEAGYAICYTSGTTGRPKGVLTTYRGTYLSGLANAYQAEMTASSVYLWILPAFHAVGWTYPIAVTAAGSGQVCLRSVGDYTPIWDSFLRDGITTYCAAPTVQIAIINHPKAKPLDHKIRAMIAGAAPSATLIQGLEKLNISVNHVYGLTETYGPFTSCIEMPEWQDLDRTEFYKLKAMQGFAYVTSDSVRVIRQGSSAKDGFEDVARDGKEMGEIIVRGNMSMKEYYNDPDATAKAFEGGYFHTGDLAVMEPNGMVSILDRGKDIIISGGENASSLAIESALFEHPDVLEVAVIARPHEKYGERAHAYVILRDDAKGKWKSKAEEFEKELKEFSKGKLPGFARPEWVEVVESLPKTSTGKIQKQELRKKYGFARQ